MADPAQYTPWFAYHPAGGAPSREQALYCEGVALERIAEAAGTPAYVYSREGLEAAYVRLDRAFGSLPHTVCYAVKANANLSVLRVLARRGASFDIVSGGELDRLRRIGVPGGRIVFSGVGKSREEIRDALRYPGTRAGRGGILLFNVESGAELDVLLAEASRHVAAGGERPSIAIRVNPDVAAGGHPHISTGAHHHKFGVDWAEARKLYLAHRDSRAIVWRGITAHIGSQIVSIAPYRRALARLASYVRDLGRQGIRLDFVDIGGGLGIRYADESPLVPDVFARALAEIVRPLGCRLLIEPGRAIAGPAGVLLTRVLYVKQTRGKTFVIVDAAMNDLIRPVLYDATHAITPAVRGPAAAAGATRVDVVGPVCESGDFLARDWPLPPVQSGDLLVVWAAGAYGFAQSSNYNARRRAAEVLVDGRRFRIARRRESYDDLVRNEL
ncbi:MAG: diaminopimelate decarboxylase [Acidobacteriia bacterium]|nr:diaminopimelate decarboxylase [Terriglobia bacterium]